MVALALVLNLSRAVRRPPRWRAAPMLLQPLRGPAQPKRASTSASSSLCALEPPARILMLVCLTGR